MCDTFVALPDFTAAGAVIFGKNSDRPSGEVQVIETRAPRRYGAGSTVRCTYLEIPQVRRTFAVVLSRPRWMWGAEMGANENGVVIGNEAVWTNQPYADTGLLGMDLLRLGLERGTAARDALDVIIELMDKFGQGGNCAENFSMNYHNSFLIADPKEAWVLETAGPYWVAERVGGGVRSISNALTIHGPGDLRHPKLEAALNDTEDSTRALEFDFAFMFSGRSAHERPPATSREGRVRSLCESHEGEFTAETAKSILRDHQGGICMHGDFETRGSQVSMLGADRQEHWLIEGPFPCERNFQLQAL